jgi:hypothetical protein
MFMFQALETRPPPAGTPRFNSSNYWKSRKFVARRATDVTPQQGAELWRQISTKDSAYRQQLLGEFDPRPGFKANHNAQQLFPKLCCASAGVYEFHSLMNAAESACQQAITLCPDLTEASLRPANLYLRQNRGDEAIKQCEKVQRAAVSAPQPVPANQAPPE